MPSVSISEKKKILVAIIKLRFSVNKNFIFIKKKTHIFHILFINETKYLIVVFTYNYVYQFLSGEYVILL